MIRMNYQQEEGYNTSSLPVKSNLSRFRFRSSPLVTTIISAEKSHFSFNFYKFELFPCSVKILRPGSHVIPKPGKRGIITSFSWASKRRLRFTAANASPGLISQFGMTYHNRVPLGRKVREDRHNFLRTLRDEYPGMGYLWILEFQKRGIPHIHLYLTQGVSYGLHKFMADLWHKIAEPESEEHLRFHMHSKNFIPWEMRSAGYLCKYLDKDHQKMVPENFEDVGRFWGAVRGLVAPGVIVTDQEIDHAFPYVSWKPSKMILRTVCKSQERKVKKKTKWRSWGRRSKGNYTILEGRSIYESLIAYHKKQSPF